MSTIFLKHVSKLVQADTVLTLLYAVARIRHGAGDEDDFPCSYLDVLQVVYAQLEHLDDGTQQHVEMVLQCDATINAIWEDGRALADVRVAVLVDRVIEWARVAPDLWPQHVRAIVELCKAM